MDEETNGSIDIDGAEPIDIIEKQQTLYHLFGFGSHVIYDSYRSKVDVKDKIEILCSLMKQTSQTRLVDIIWSQRIHRGNNELLMSPISVIIVRDLHINGNHLAYPLNIKSKRYTVHPVFRIQKCSGIESVDDNGQNKCCAIFVDEFGRVYRNWDDFLKNCRYADGLMVCPKLGIYNCSRTTNQVLLDIKKRSKGITRAFDNGSTAVGLVSAVVTGVALIPAVTVAPAVLTVAIGAGITSAAYTGVRSVYRLFDRKKHKQSIGLGDSEARNAWLNVSTGIVSVGAAGATQVVARAARNGRSISTLARNSVRVVNVAAVTVNVGGCTNEGYSFIYILCKHGSISTQHAMQLLFNLFLLKHSWTNLHEINKIMSNESMSISEMSQSQNESFEKFFSQTQKICGSATRPLVRSLKNSLKDPKAMLKNVHGSDSWLRALVGTIAKPIVRDYWRDFDKYLDQLIRKLGHKLGLEKSSMDQLISILRPMINLLRDITLTSWDKVVQSLAQFVNELPMKIQKYLKMYRLELEQRSAIAGTSLNDYVSSKPDGELRNIFNDEKQNVEKLEQIDKIYDEAYGSDDDDGLDGNRKVELLIDQYATEKTEEFEKYSPAAKTNELYETIVQILTALPQTQTEIFFSVAKYLITTHGQDIQTTLGRFISVDIFIVDIHHLLTNRSRGFDTTLRDYFVDYGTQAEIEHEFKQIYAVKNDPSLKKVCCSTCGGDVFINK